MMESVAKIEPRHATRVRAARRDGQIRRRGAPAQRIQIRVHAACTGAETNAGAATGENAAAKQAVGAATDREGWGLIATVVARRPRGRAEESALPLRFGQREHERRLLAF